VYRNFVSVVYAYKMKINTCKYIKTGGSQYDLLTLIVIHDIMKKFKYKYSSIIKPLNSFLLNLFFTILEILNTKNEKENR